MMFDTRPRKSTSPPHQGQRGIVLVIVLWMVMLLSVIATGMGYAMRTETLLATHLVDSAADYALAEAGIYHAILERANSDPDDLRPTDGSPGDWRFGGAQLRISIFDESGRIDLNTAPRELLIGLMQGAAAIESRMPEQGGVRDGAATLDSLDAPTAQAPTEEELEAIADAIIDWRDANDERGTRGAEAREYRAAGLDYVPRNADFYSVAELGEVLGMTPALLAWMRPALTVYVRQEGINPVFASRQVLLAVPGMRIEVVNDYLARRAENYAEDLPAPPPPPGMEGYLSQSDQRVYRIVSEPLREGRGSARIEAIVTLQAVGDQPYTLLGWQDGRGDPAPTQVTDDE